MQKRCETALNCSRRHLSLASSVYIHSRQSIGRCFAISQTRVFSLSFEQSNSIIGALYKIELMYIPAPQHSNKHSLLLYHLFSSTTDNFHLCPTNNTNLYTINSFLFTSWNLQSVRLFFLTTHKNFLSNKLIIRSLCFLL